MFITRWRWRGEGFLGELALHLVQDVLGGGGEAAREKRGADTHPQGDYGHGEEDPSFAGRGVRQGAIFLDGDFAEENALGGPQQVAGGENDTSGGPGGPVPVGLIGAKKDKEFADEAVEHGQAERRERDKEEEGGELGHGSGETAVLGNLKGVAAVVEHADEEEERAGGDAVGKHLEDGALHGNVLEGEDAEHDEAEVADAGIGDEFFQIGLDESDQRAVDDADNGEGGDNRGGAVRSVGEERQAEANHAVGAHFQEHAGEDDGAGGGRFHVGVGQPGVEREERDLDGKSQEEGEEEVHLLERGQTDGAGLQHLLDGGEIEGAAWDRGRTEIVQPDDAHEHEDGAGHGVEHEFDGSVDAALVSPDADEEVHGNQHHFPEEEEEEEVEREEDADHADFEHQQHDEKFLDAVLDAVPGGEHRDGGEERG